jgi:integrase
MCKAPTQSTLMTHNAAMNRVFDAAVARDFLTDANRPKLKAKGKARDRRPAFDLNEVHAMFGSFEGWTAQARNDKSRELRLLLRGYVEVLLDTGAREPYGEEPSDQPPEQALKTDMNRSCDLTVKGKTGKRQTLGMNPTVKAFVRIIERNYGVRNTCIEPFEEVAIASNDDFVFRINAKEKPTSFQNMFERFLDEHNLLINPRAEQKRVFYSLRHAYAALALTRDEVPIHTRAKQTGKSVVRIEKRYSHLKGVKAIEQRRNCDTRRLIAAGSVIEQTSASKAKQPSKVVAKKAEREGRSK